MAPLSCRDRAGFTLIELMIAMAIAAIVLMAMYVSFETQQRTQVRENQAVQAQQNGRAALLLMEREIRAAGNDPTTVWGTDGVDNAFSGAFDGTIDDASEAENNRMADGFDNDCSGSHDDVNADGVDETYGIKIAGAHEILISMDLNGDRDVCDEGEYVRYIFAPGNDADGDGWADVAVGGAGRFARAEQYGDGLDPIAENIEAVSFAYAFDSDIPPNGLDEDGSGNVIWAYDNNLADGLHELNTQVFEDGTTAGLATPVPVSDIRAVRIWVLARTRSPVRGHEDRAVYVVGNLAIDASDTTRDAALGTNAHNRHMRRILTTTVVCRNMGLE